LAESAATKEGAEEGQQAWVPVADPLREENSWASLEDQPEPKDNVESHISTLAEIFSI
jgi:hypothetical protein